MTVDAPTAQSADIGGRHTAAERREAGMPTPLVGMLLFIASEVMFFGGLFAAYFNARASVGLGEWHPPAGAHELEMLPIALPLTLVLVASSFTMQFGVWAIRRGDQGALRVWTALTLLLGVAFLIGQLYDYSILDITIRTNLFGSTFFTLTGFHGVHVSVGIIMLMSLLVMSLRGNLGPEKAESVEIVGLYWHFVDIVWIVIFTVVYLIP